MAVHIRIGTLVLMDDGRGRGRYKVAEVATHQEGKLAGQEYLRNVSHGLRLSVALSQLLERWPAASQMEVQTLGELATLLREAKSKIADVLWQEID